MQNISQSLMYQYLLNYRTDQDMIQQKISKSQQPVQAVLEPTAATPLTAETFLFRQMVIDILSHCKKNIKGPPFEDMQVDRLLETNQTRTIDIYHQYFLIGIANNKTREVVCSRIERLIRENIVNKDSLPAQMITGIINARAVNPTGGGSTASSGTNSVVGSALNLTTERSLEIGKLVSTIICHTLQSSSEIASGLVFLLEGCRNKNNGNLFVQLIEDVYANLAKFRKKPIDRFLEHLVSKIVSEVEYHQTDYLGFQRRYLSQRKNTKVKQNILSTSKYNQAPSIMLNKESGDFSEIPQPPRMHQFILKGVPYNCKDHLCVHPNEEDSKFGKCFVCQRGANNYDKNLFVPLCSMQCKNKLKRINQQCFMNDHFVFVKWILEVLVSSNPSPGAGDEVLYSLLMREVREGEKLCAEDISQIMEIIVSNFSLQAIGITSSSQNLQSVSHIISNRVIESSAMIMSNLVRKYAGLLFRSESSLDSSSEKQKQKIPHFHYTKVILLEMVRLLECLTICSNPLQLTLLRSLIEILSSQDSSIIVLKQLYLRCDCRITQSNLVERIFNILSQYSLYNNTANSSSSNANSLQNLGTATSLGFDNSSTIGSITAANYSTNTCVDVAIAGLDQILTSVVKVMNQFANLGNGAEQSKQVIKQKKIKKYLQSKFVEDFNKKPGKAVDSLRRIFEQISPKEVAVIIKENMDYETKVKKTTEKINRQEVGAFFGTAKKDKNAIMDDFNQEIYKEFLKLLFHEYEGKEIDDCLRITFNSFLMPKQGQQVEVVLGPLSLALEPFLGMKIGKQATATYQLIMVVLMVQTSTNPNVKQNEKLKYEGFKKFCTQIDENFTEARMMQIFDRVKKRPLEIFMEYKNRDVFYKKYLQPEDLKAQFWKYLPTLSLIQEKKQEPLMNKKQEISMPILKKSQKQRENKKERNAKQEDEEGEVSKSSLQIEEEPRDEETNNFLSFTFLNLWQFIYMALVNRQNLRGLEQSCILYGRCQLLKQFEAFFCHLYKMHVDFQERSSNTLQTISNSCKLIILKLAIDYSNCVIGRQAWLIIIKIIHKLDTEEEKKSRIQSPKKGDSLYASYQYEASDKLFTRTNIFDSRRLKEFLEAMCEFSSSEVKTDVKYTRQMYILHHIAQIIEYNLQRFESLENSSGHSLWKVVWPTIRSYFRNICLHPRKEICMSAIDSLKQLTMKMMKLKSKKQMNDYEINHTELMSIYLYIFERSPSYIKDLIINILLNVVCREMRSGWEQLYSMLEISDSEDKTVVMKVVNRLIRDVQPQNLANPLRLHQIVLKQLRIADEEAQYSDIVEALWELCQHFDRLEIWLETLSKVKDIYKSSTHVSVLYFLYRICNECIKKIPGKTSKTVEKSINESKERKDSAEQIEDELQLSYMKQALQQEKNQGQKGSELSIDITQAHKLIYFEVFSVQMHILEIRNPKLFVDSITAFKTLSVDVVFRNIGNDNENKTGFLTLWEMFITSSINSVHFCYFLHDYFGLIFKNFAEIKAFLIKNEREPNFYSIGSLKQLALVKRQIILWLVRLFVETSKDEVLQLSQEDQDLKKGYQQIFEQRVLASNKTQLIEFYLSSKEYEAKCIQHLVLLKIFKLYFEYQSNLTQDEVKQIGDANMRVLEMLIQSYETAVAVNNKPLLRHFLWNNEFFKGYDYLPGLLKQELRSYEIILKYFSLQDMKGKVYQTIVSFIRIFIHKSSLLAYKYPKSKTIQVKNAVPNKPVIMSADESQNEAYNKITQTLYQDLGLWVTNSDHLLCLSIRKICKTIKQSGAGTPIMDHRELFNLCIELSRVGNSQVVLKECSLLLEELVRRIY